MASRFSGATKARLCRLMDSLYTHSDLDTLFLELDLRGYRAGGSNKEAKVRNLLDTVEDSLDEETATRTILALIRRVLEEDVASLLKRLSEDPYGPMQPSWQPLLDKLLASLKADGWESRDGRLLPSTPEPVSIADEITALEAMLAELGSPEAQKHYRQAVDNFRAGPGNEEACNGQLRNLLDVVYPFVCEHLSGRRIEDANGAIQHLHDKELLEPGLFDLLRGIYKLSNTRGAHVGLSGSDEALFRLHITTAVVRYLLRLQPTR